MGQRGAHVADLAVLVGRILPDVGVLAKAPPFNHPVLPSPASFGDDHLRLEDTLRLLHRLPRPFRLHDMGVGIDYCHARSSFPGTDRSEHPYGSPALPRSAREGLP